MDRKISLLLLSVTFATGPFVAAGLAQAAPQAPAAAPDASRPAFLAPKKETPAPEAPRRARGISPEIAAQLAAAAPKFTPPPPKPAPKPEEELVDARDVDKPRNGIIRLPQYVVQETKPTVFTERAISTEKGITDIAMQRYISDIDRAFNRFRLPVFAGYSLTGKNATEDRALAMYAEDERLKNMSDLKDTASTVGKSDRTQGTFIMREAQRTYLRTPEFGGRQSSNPAGMPERASP